MKSLKYKNVFGKFYKFFNTILSSLNLGEAIKETFEDVKPNDITADGTLINVNTKFVAMSWKCSGGGPVAVFKADTPKRIEQNQPFISGHNGPVCDIKFSPFHTKLLATASEDATVRIWELEEDGLTKNYTQETQKYSV